MEDESELDLKETYPIIVEKLQDRLGETRQVVCIPNFLSPRQTPYGTFCRRGYYCWRCEDRGCER